jgi:hypothetical protein
MNLTLRRRQPQVTVGIPLRSALISVFALAACGDDASHRDSGGQLESGDAGDALPIDARVADSAVLPMDAARGTRLGRVQRCSPRQARIALPTRTRRPRSGSAAARRRWMRALRRCS